VLEDVGRQLPDERDDKLVVRPTELRVNVDVAAQDAASGQFADDRAEGALESGVLDDVRV
jgi:hypothetical protein